MRRVSRNAQVHYALVEESTRHGAHLYGNGRINRADLGVRLSEWNPARAAMPSDIDRGSSVDGADLEILMAFWRPSPGNGAQMWSASQAPAARPQRGLDKCV
jgi:hypothetical protein